MRIQGAALVLVVGTLLVGCATQPSSEPAPTPTLTPTPTIAVAPIGEAAIPLGCADLLAESDVAALGSPQDVPLEVAIDENRLDIDMSVADLQRGTLRCAWAARYGSTDFHGSVEVQVAPSTASALDPAVEVSYFGPFAPLDDDTLLVCDRGGQVDDTGALYNNCDVLQLRGGYRIELETSGLVAATPGDSSVALSLLAKLDAAVDGAAPARAIAPAGGTDDPASVCAAPEIAPLLDRLGAVGDPVVAASTDYPGVTTCTWSRVDEILGDVGPQISVLPGGAWAIPRMQDGVASIFLQTHPSADGSYLVGRGDGVSAWRAIGDDLIFLFSGDSAAGDSWEAFLEATW